MRKLTKVVPFKTMAQNMAFASKAKAMPAGGAIHEQNERLSDATQTFDGDSDFSAIKYGAFTALSNPGTTVPLIGLVGMGALGTTMGTVPAATFGVSCIAALRLAVKGRSNKVKKDLTGKVCVVTGGSKGIGLETAVQLAEMGGTVIIAAPADTKEAAMAEVNQRVENNKVTFVPLDLGDANQILAFSNLIKTQFKSLDILVNNAAMATSEFDTTAAGNEKMVGVNFLGPFQLTELLVPQLQQCNGRVVYVTCSTHVAAWKKDVVKTYFSPKVTKENFLPTKQYGASKLGNILHVEMLKYRGGFSVCSVNPGFSKTGLIKKSIEEEKDKDVVDWVLDTLSAIRQKNAYEGSQTVVNASVRDDIETGGHYYECGSMMAGLTSVARSKKEAAELCNWAANHTIKRLSRQK